MQRNGILQHAVAKVGTDRQRGQKVHLSTQDLPQLDLHAGEANQSRNVTRLELHEHVDVALLSKVLPKDRAEEREPTCVMPTAEVDDPIASAFDRG